MGPHDPFNNKRKKPRQTYLLRNGGPKYRAVACAQATSAAHKYGDWRSGPSGCLGFAFSGLAALFAVTTPHPCSSPRLCDPSFTTRRNIFTFNMSEKEIDIEHLQNAPSMNMMRMAPRAPSRIASGGPA